MTPLTAIAQLRHLYDQMNAGRIHDTTGAARDLLAPAIEALEKAHTPGAQRSCILDCDSPSFPASDAERHQCGCKDCLAWLDRYGPPVQDAGVDGGLATSAAIEALERHEETVEAAFARANRAINAVQGGGRAPVEVKPLIWDRKTYGSADCSTASLGLQILFTIDRLNAACWMLRGCLSVSSGNWPAPSLLPHTLHLTLADAQAAAQIEWTTFIRSALHP